MVSDLAKGNNLRKVSHKHFFMNAFILFVHRLHISLSLMEKHKLPKEYSTGTALPSVMFITVLEKLIFDGNGQCHK
jgi:hypothetical protein